jgi:hypothetical protein
MLLDALFHCRQGSPSPPTLEFANIFNAGIVHKEAHFLIFLFSPPYMLFLAMRKISPKIGICDLELA